MFKARVWFIDVIHDMVDKTLYVTCDDEFALEEMVECYIDNHSTDIHCIRYHIDEVENG